MKPTPRRQPGPWALMVLDGRGRRVALLRVGAVAGGADAAALDPAILAVARRSVWRSIGSAGWVHLGLVIALEVFFVFLAVIGIHSFLTSPFARPFAWTAPAAIVLIGLFMVWNTWLNLRYKHARRLAEGFVRAGCCAACGYALRGLAAEDDGCVTCPECAAGWKVPGGGF